MSAARAPRRFAARASLDLERVEAHLGGEPDEHTLLAAPERAFAELPGAYDVAVEPGLDALVVGAYAQLVDVAPPERGLGRSDGRAERPAVAVLRPHQREAGHPLLVGRALQQQVV